MTQQFKFLRFFAGHPTAANLLMLIALFFGFISIGDLRRETFPDFAPTKVEISVLYPGASAEEIEEAVSQRIEQAVRDVNDVVEIKSESRENMGRVEVEMRDGGDISRFLNEIKTEVEAIDDFPEETEVPVIRELGRTDSVVSIAVSGPMSVSDLKLYCEEIKDRLLLLPEVSLVEILGFSDHQIRIQVPSATLMQFGLSISDITDAVARQNVDLPAGTLETPDLDIMVRFQDERRSLHGYEDLVIVSRSTGEEIRLGEIATVHDVFENEEDRILFNGERAGLIKIQKLKTEDSLNIMSVVQEFLAREKQLAPPGVHFSLTQDRTDIVRDRLTMLSRNGLQGLVLVFAVLWLFFTFRLSFWVAMGLPVSFMATFFVMKSLGLSINMLTMVALLLALGLLMDDAIVISENVMTQLTRGKNALDAAVEGTAQVTRGVFSSFITTLVVFGSIPLVLEGEMGKVLWVLPVVLIVTLTVSLVEAFFILPNHLAHSLKHFDPKKRNRFRAAFERQFENVRHRVLGGLVDLAVNWRYLFLGFLVAGFMISIGMIAGGRLKIIGFPEIDGDVLEARILTPQGTPLAEMERIVHHVVTAVKGVDADLTPQQPDGKSLVQNIMVQYGQNRDAYETGPHVATVFIDLLKAEVRTADLDTITGRWRKAVGTIPGVINITYKEPVIGPGGLPIDIRLQGKDLDELKHASLELLDWLRRYEGVFDLQDDLRPGKPEIRVRLKPGALARGLDASMIARQLRTAFFGRTATEIQVGDESYEIDVQLADADQDSPADLENFYVTDREGRLYPLGEVAYLEQGRGIARIFRVDGQRTVSVQGDLNMRIANSNEILKDTQQRFLPGLLERHPGVTYSLEGQQKETGKTGRSMIKAFMLGIFGVFVLLSFQLKSYLEALVVMVAIPFSLAGVIWGHIVMGLDLSTVSLMGFVSLAGVVINDSILLVEFIRLGVEKGYDAVKAAKLASRLRFRAVLLTSLTTIAGLAPLLFEKSLQAQVLIPLVTSLVFGLIASTALVLIVVPCFYSVLADFGRNPAGASKPIGPPPPDHLPPSHDAGAGGTLDSVADTSQPA